MTIPISSPLEDSENTVEVCNAETQTESLAVHGLRENFAKIDDDHIIGQNIEIYDNGIFREEMMTEREPEIDAFVSEVLRGDGHSDKQPRYLHEPGQAGECGCLGAVTCISCIA